MVIEKKNSDWSQPVVAGFSGKYSDDSPFFSANGNKLYFESKRPYPDSTEAGKWGTWYVEKRDDVWSEAIFDSVFTSMKIETPSIASNSNLYFASGKRGGEGSADIFVSKFINGKYSEPQNLSPCILIMLIINYI